MTDEQKEQLEEYKQAFLNRLEDEQRFNQRLLEHIIKLEEALLRYASHC